MAHASTFTDAYPKAGILARLGNWFERSMHNIGENNSRLRRVKTLQAMDDTQLAAMRIKREDIIHHVFCDLYYM